MTKQDIVEVVELFEGAWGLNFTRERRRAIQRAWYRYLHDLEKSAVIAVLDRLVATAQMPPRVGEVRRQVIDSHGGDKPPPVEIAWNEAQTILEQYRVGLTVDTGTTHPLVLKAIRRLDSRIDHRVFETIYIELLRQDEESRYGIDPTGLDDA